MPYNENCSQLADNEYHLNIYFFVIYIVIVFVIHCNRFCSRGEGHFEEAVFTYHISFAVDRFDFCRGVEFKTAAFAGFNSRAITNIVYKSSPSFNQHNYCRDGYEHCGIHYAAVDKK